MQGGRLVTEVRDLAVLHVDGLVDAGARAPYGSGGGPLGHPKIFINLVSSVRRPRRMREC